MIKNRGRILRFFSFLKKSICTIPRCEPVFFRIIHLLCCYRVYRKTGWRITDFNFREINFTKFSWKFQEYLCWSLSYILFCPNDNNMYILKKCNLNQWIGHLIPSEIIFFHFFWFCTWNLFPSSYIRLYYSGPPPSKIISLIISFSFISSILWDNFYSIVSKEKGPCTKKKKHFKKSL